MTDYISREEAKRLACQLYCAVTDTCDDDSECAVAASFDAIPAADVRPVVRGKWEPCGHFVSVCSNCHKYWVSADDEYDYHFCPNCGADMREPPKEET